MASRGNQAERNGSAQTKTVRGRVDGQRKGRSTKQIQNRPKRNRKKAPIKNSEKQILEEYGACGVLFMKALLDPFHFVNNTTQLPCVPAGPKVKTKRIVGWARGTLSTGSNGYGFIMVAPYRICNDEPDVAEICVAHTTNTFATTSFNTAATGIANANLPNTTVSYLQDPSYRIVACGIKIGCIGPLLYRGGRIGYAQLPNFTDSWTGRSLDDVFALPDAVSHHVDGQKRTFSWTFSSSAPGYVVSEQCEFMNYNDNVTGSNHCMGLAISGAPGSGTGLSFEWEVCTIFEYQALGTGAARVVPTDAIFTDTSIKASQSAPQVVKENRGETTHIQDLQKTLKSVGEATSNVHQLRQAAEMAQQLLRSNPKG